MFRPLRITVSVVSGICCVLVVVLWVRSYWHKDQFLKVAANGYSGIQSESGYVSLLWSNDSRLSRYLALGWVRGASYGPQFLPNESLPRLILRPLRVVGDGCEIPYWAITAATALVTAIPWLPWRFSLKTIFLATTLVAVLLGVVVWALRG
jgi:hypothetical protein